ncbi:MAG: hypothetical protein KC441_18685 [Anaerolineales bacterium]|nr:hypothetical protein [Anaerolineales bacterium]
MSSGDFYGLPVHTLENDHLKLEYLAEAGPRLVRLFAAGSDQNILAEAPETFWETPYGRFYIRGGHRLWHAPEKMARTYIPDNDGLVVTELPEGVRLEAPQEPDTAVHKTMTIHLHADRPALTIEHTLLNGGVWPVELAPWAITQVRLGGTAVFPQQVGQLDEDGLLPNRQLTLWPYTRLNDARLHLDDDYILVGPDVDAQAFKIGCFNRHGWLAYFLDDVLFVKRFPVREDQLYPDFGCNAEIYANDKFMELESLGPLTLLQPGQSVSHSETWEVHGRLTPPQTADEMRGLINQYVL